MSKAVLAHEDNTRSIELDSLRGIAVLAVVVYHLAGAGLTPPLSAYRWPAYGMFGVDLFFVLSGYFITFSVVSSRDWSATKFVSRRISRIYPAFLVSIASVLAFKSLAGTLPNGDQMLLGLTAHLFMLHNLVPGFAGMINGVYWTLGIEFPYYLLMAVLAPLFRHRGRRLVVTTAFIMIALTWRALVFAFIPASLTDNYGRFFYSTQLPGALDAFSVGGCAAIISMSYPSIVFRYKELLTWLGIAVAICALWYVERHAADYWSNWTTAIVWRFWLSVGLGLIVLGLPGSHLARPLTLTCLPWIGKVSYSMYLYHFPIIIMTQQALSDYSWQAQTVFVIAATLAVSWLSWRYVETRFHPTKS